MEAVRCRHGFTLIELLVVITLIAVITGIVVLSIPSRSPAELQRTEAQRLHARMIMAHEEAVLRARTFGLRIETDGYHFMQFTQSNWRRFDVDHPLREHRLPEAVTLELAIEGTEISLRDGEKREDDARPQILFLASGEVMPDYTLHVLGDDSSVEYRIAAGEEEWINLTDSR